MTDATSTVRTYTVEERVLDGDYAKHADMGEWCREPISGGYVCSIKAGHAGPQHVAVGGSRVCAVKDRDQSGDGPDNTLTLLDGRRVQVPAEIYPTVRDEQHQYTVMLDELRTQVREARDARDRVQASLDTLREREEERMEAFRQRVGQVAMRYARDHNWCSVVQRALEELGIEVVQRWRVRTDVKISHHNGWEAVRGSVYVTVESARDRGNVYQDVDNMDADAAINVLEQEGIEIPDGWQFESFDASTSDVELVED